jgi:hypothetical protein
LEEEELKEGFANLNVNSNQSPAHKNNSSSSLSGMIE